MVHQVAIEDKYFSYRQENKSRNKGNQQEVLQQNHTSDHHDTLLLMYFFHLYYTPGLFQIQGNAIKFPVFSL